jgi:N-sulfoglucosamine sulfohydrolase
MRLFVSSGWDFKMKVYSMNYKLMIRLFFLVSSICLFTLGFAFEKKGRPNILFLTLDDMNWDSMGVYGSKVPKITPHMDALAKKGLRFKYAYVQSPNCSPSRNVFQSGRYPHNSGLVGFYNVQPSFKTLPEQLKENGYITAVLNKPRDSSMHGDYDQFWDHHEIMKADRKRDAASYKRVFEDFLERVREDKKPFYCVVNVADPHKPFFGEAASKKEGMDDFEPSRLYKTNEVEVPPFLPEAKEIHQEIADYYNSVKRADDCIGSVLEAFRESEFKENTIVMLVSDHGMALPFAKSSLYPNGVRTPWLVTWPGKIKPNTVEKRHMISAIDFMPTILDLCGIDPDPTVDGRSFLPLIQGREQAGRDKVFVQFNENAGGNPSPMRAVITKKYCYVFNAWSNGERAFMSASNFHTSYKKMKKMAATDPKIEARFNHLQKRSVEELYAIDKDPHALKNLIDKSVYKSIVEQLQSTLENWMKENQDPALDAFLIKEDPQKLDAWFMAEDKSAELRAQTIQWKRYKNRAGGTGKNKKLFIK